MRIAVNTRFLIKNKLDGIAWFTYHTLKEMTQKHSDFEFIFIFDRPFSQDFIFSKNIIPVSIFPPARHPFLWFLWFEFVIPKILKKYNANIFLSPDGYVSLHTKIPTISVMHDINFMHRPKDLPFWVRNYYQYYFPKFAQKAKRIATVSEYSKNDISQTFSIPKKKIDVVYNGSNSLYKPLNESEKNQVKQKYSQNTDYFIFIGTLHPRKNVANLLLAFDKFRKNIQQNFKILIVGSEMFKTSEMFNVYSKMEYKNDVIFTGWLPPEELSKVLGAAFSLTFVPFFEGFGIPVLESMYCDVPVLSSNTTSLPEVCGEAAILVNPDSVDSISEGMLKIFSDKNLRNSLIEKAKTQREKFSWQKTSEKLWNCLEKCL